MSLMSLNRVFKKYGTVFGLFFAGIILIGALAGLGNNLVGGGAARQADADTAAQAAASGPGAATVAKVGDDAVTLATLDQLVDTQLQQQSMGGAALPVPSPADRNRYRVAVLDQVKQRQAIVVAAKNAGVTVSDSDMTAARDKAWAQEKGGFAQTLGLKPTASDTEIDAALAKQNPNLSVASLKERAFPAEAVRNSIYPEKLQAALKKDVRVDENLVRRSYDEVQVRHILIGTAGPQGGGLPDGQAKTKAEKLLAEVKANPAKMAALATQFTDDPGSKAKGGLYDWAPASQYVTPFTEAALKAGIGKVYPDIVKTQFGYHIIKLEGERPAKASAVPPGPQGALPGMTPPAVGLPKDFDQNKQKYLDEYADKVAQGKMQEAVAAALPLVKVDITDPSLRAAQLMNDAQATQDKKAQDAKLTEALAELNKADAAADTEGVIALQKAQIYERLNKNPEAIAAYRDALKSRGTPETHMAIAALYLRQKDKANAKKELIEADKFALANPQKMIEFASYWDQVGDKAKAKQIQQQAIEIYQKQAAASQPQLPPQAPAPPTAKPAK